MFEPPYHVWTPSPCSDPLTMFEPPHHWWALLCLSLCCGGCTAEGAPTLPTLHKAGWHARLGGLSSASGVQRQRWMGCEDRDERSGVRGAWKGAWGRGAGTEVGNAL